MCLFESVRVGGNGQWEDKKIPNLYPKLIIPLFPNTQSQKKLRNKLNLNFNCFKINIYLFRPPYHNIYLNYKKSNN